MNTKLLRQIIREIEAEPLRCNMTDWVDTDDPIASCGSVACIAGFAAAINLRETAKGRQSWKSLIKTLYSKYYNIIDDATDLLDITRKQRERLFFIVDWPHEFIEKYKNVQEEFNTLDLEIRSSMKAKRRKEAAVVIERIRHFIRTKGRQ